MRTLKMAVTVMALALILAASGYVVHAQTVVTIQYFPGPAIDSSGIQTYLTNLLAGTVTEVPALLPQDIIATTSLTRGYTYYRVVITNPQGIALRDYIIDQDSNDQFNGVPQHSLRLTQDMISFDYDQWRPGIKADGSMITSGANTQVVNKFVIIGVCVSFTGITPAAYDNSVRYIVMQNPFTVTTTVKVRGTTGDPTIIAMRPWSTDVIVVPRVVLKIQRGGESTVAVNVTGMRPDMSYTVQFAPTVTGPWADYKTVYGGADGTGAFTAPNDGNAGFFRTKSPF